MLRIFQTVSKWNSRKFAVASNGTRAGQWAFGRGSIPPPGRFKAHLGKMGFSSERSLRAVATCYAPTFRKISHREAPTLAGRGNHTFNFLFPEFSEVQPR
jgi:hypothetical protein